MVAMTSLVSVQVAYTPLRSTVGTVHRFNVALQSTDLIDCSMILDDSEDQLEGLVCHAMGHSTTE
jgi:hypothetical protein